MTLKPFSKCQVFVYTGIARFIYPNGVTVNQFKQNSARAWVPAGYFGGNVPSGKMIQWYQVDGSANVMMFLLTNMQAFPADIRVNVQTF